MALLPLLAGCETLAYYAQSVGGHLDLIGRREPIERLLRDPATAPRLAARLGEVVEIRRFASARLGLPENGSYLSYAELGRVAAVWSLVAAPELSIEPRRWCYPVIGCASYRGYFAEADAQRHAGSLSDEGFDTVIEPVPAYSTLGWFDDPLPSTVIDWPLPRLAGLIFHELTHQRIYVRDHSEFNEALAVAVARAGVARWLEGRGDRDALDAWRRDLARDDAYVALLLETRARLAAWYAGDRSPDELRAGKRRIFSRLKADYRTLRAGWNGYSGYDRSFERRLNNAGIASVATYHRLLPAFERLLARLGGDFSAFYRECEALAAMPDVAAREAALERLAGRSPGADAG